MWTFVIWLATVLVGTALFLVGLAVCRHIARTCPSCHRRALTLIGMAPIPGEHRGGGCVRMQVSREDHRCGACGAEHCREDVPGSPLIPKAAWDAGARTLIPLPAARQVRTSRLRPPPSRASAPTVLERGHV